MSRPLFHFHHALVLYPYRGTQLGVVALWRSRTDYIIQTQEEHHMFLNKPNHCISLRRNMWCSSLCIIQLKSHRLHRLTRDDFDELPFPHLQDHAIFQYDMFFIAFFTIDFESPRFNGSSSFSITCC